MSFKNTILYFVKLSFRQTAAKVESSTLRSKAPDATYQRYVFLNKPSSQIVVISQFVIFPRFPLPARCPGHLAKRPFGVEVKADPGEGRSTEKFAEQAGGEGLLGIHSSHGPGDRPRSTSDRIGVTRVTRLRLAGFPDQQKNRFACKPVNR